MSSAADHEGMDYVWVAADTTGRVAVLVTAGCGPVPAYALPGIDSAEERVLQLPRIGGCELFCAAPHPDSFIALAERGLFVYDWMDVHRTRAESIDAYELVARPKRELRVDVLPASLNPVLLHKVQFGLNLISRGQLGL